MGDFYHFQDFVAASQASQHLGSIDSPSFQRLGTGKTHRI